MIFRGGRRFIREISGTQRQENVQLLFKREITHFKMRANLFLPTNLVLTFSNKSKGRAPLAPLECPREARGLL